MATGNAAETAFNLTDLTNLYKIKYGKRSENAYNSANVALGRIKKSYDFVGKKMEFPMELSFQGGVGAGTLPEANVGEVEDVNFTAKKVYARALYDRESIKAAASSEGAFFQNTAETVRKTVESFNRWASIILHGDGTGSLGTVATGGVTDNGGGDYDLVISDATWIAANWSKRDFINIESGNTDLFEITAVDKANKTISVQRASGASQVPAAGDVIFMQGSENNVPQGLRGVVLASSGTKFGVSIADPYISQQIDASSATITPDLINQIVLSVEEESGQTPNMALCSYTQFRKLINQLDDQKRYNLPPRYQSDAMKGVISFRGVEVMTTQGPIGVFPDRFVREDLFYVLNDNFIRAFHRPGFGWFDDDGTVFLRVADSDEYEARYGGYYENYIAPPFHGVISNLSA
jgi:hypothetical protein